MKDKQEQLRLEKLVESNADQSWADYDTVESKHPLLRRYISSYTYSVGCLREQKAKRITRAFPSVMTQIYFEFHGGLSEIRGRDHGFGSSAGNHLKNGVAIEKRVYIKQGLGSWFDIYQLPCNKPTRPIKNLKVDLYPMALYELFGCAPKDVAGEDLQLSELMGQSTITLMLEEMEAVESGPALVRVAERYFLEQLWLRVRQERLEIKTPQASGIHYKGGQGTFTPPLPRSEGSLTDQAKQFQKSERWLQKRYAEVYGMSFKQIQGNLRFQQTHQNLWRHMADRIPVNLTTLSYNSGYFDQAHFIKDFKRYTGMTPGQYLRSNFDQDSQYLWYW